jgi:hypothetical protein
MTSRSGAMPGGETGFTTETRRAQRRRVFFFIAADDGNEKTAHLRRRCDFVKRFLPKGEERFSMGWA